MAMPSTSDTAVDDIGEHYAFDEYEDFEYAAVVDLTSEMQMPSNQPPTRNDYTIMPPPPSQLYSRFTTQYTEEFTGSTMASIMASQTVSQTATDRKRKINTTANTTAANINKRVKKTE